ncbi:MAG TPA: hypothetical protein VLL76_09855 [Candidatus Omnitrophota bacterium]|nr:hypothetical protein [Candidatus Omnitrophota bacterium]
MDLNVVLEVAIGLTLMYLLLSLFVTVVNEAISRSLGIRASNLHDGLDRIMGKETKQGFDEMPLVKSIAQASGTHLYDHLPKETYVQGVVQQLRAAGALVDGATDVISAGIDKLPDGNFKDVLSHAKTRAGTDVAAFEEHLGSWFDSAMAHVRAAYQRKLHLVSLLVGIALATFLNADTFHVANVLWKDPTVRQSVVTTAEGVVAKPAVDDKGNVLIGPDEIRANLTSLPIGWGPGAVARFKAAPFSTFFGWLFTGLALALGAPFWFGLLSKFINIRASANKS